MNEVLQIGFGAVLGALVAIGVGVLSLYFASQAYEFYQVMKRITPTEITALSPDTNVAEVTGTVVSAGDSVESPISNTECVAYSHETRRNVADEDEEREAGGPTPDHSSTTTDEREESVPFYADDGTGRVLIDARKADFELGKNVSQRSSRGSEVERVLCVGDPVYAIGDVVERIEEPQGSNIGGVLSRMLGEREGGGQLMQTIRETGQPQALRPADDELILTRGQHSPALFVSDSSEQGGERRQLLRAVKFAGFGVFFVLLAVFGPLLGLL